MPLPDNSKDMGFRTHEELPATTYLQQPPCRGSQQIEHQIHAIVPKDPGSYFVETSCDEATDTVAKLITIDGRRHLYITDTNGVSDDPDNPGTVREQCDRMFANCKRLLDKFGAKFTDVYRTWCYLVDMSEVAELGTVDYGIRSLRPATHRPIDDLPRYTQPYIPAHQRIGPIH